MQRRLGRIHWLALLWAALVISQTAARTTPTHQRSETRFDVVGAKARLAQVVDHAERAATPQVVGQSLWHEQLDAWRPTIEAARTHGEFAEAVNQCFVSMAVSHLHYFYDEEWSYWFVRSTFAEEGEEDEIEHIGVMPQMIGGRWFVRGILEGSPAARANIRVGDELVAVDAEKYEPIESFRGKAGVAAILTLRRRPELTVHVPIKPVKESLFEAGRRAQRESVRVIVSGRDRIAYLHVWSLMGDGQEFDDLLGLQEKVDGLILDFRDGFGGAPSRATQFLLGTDGQSTNDGRSVWHKPVVILIADGTRSAKEMVVDAVKKAGRAPLVGKPTPGHVTTVGAVRRVGDDGLLMLPGMKLELEGKPTQPDYLVPCDIRYCAGADPQLDTARIILTRLITELNPRRNALTPH